MKFPARLYHALTEAHLRSGHAEYPIVITSQEDLDALEFGWCEDPVEAAEYLLVPPPPPEESPSSPAPIDAPPPIPTDDPGTIVNDPPPPACDL